MPPLRALVFALAFALTVPAMVRSAASEAGWRQAELWGGDVRTLEVDPRDRGYVLAGTFSGQIYRSTDAGETWRPAGEPAVFAGWSVQALAFDPNQTQRVWAALTRVWDETGFVAVSDDRGRTWERRSQGLPERQVYSLALVPGSPGVLYAGTRVGVYGSRDHGRSWRALTTELPELQKVTSLLVDDRDPDIVLAGTWRRAYRSLDGGRTWRRLDNGMALDSEVFSLQPVPGRAGELWASTCGWVYRGRGGGDSWQRFERGLSERRTPSFSVLPTGRLLAGTVDGIFTSADGGTSWQRSGAEGLAVHALEYHAAHPARVWAATEGGGVWRSDDGGETFAPSSDGISGLRVAGLAVVGGEVVVAIRHAGPRSGVYSSFDGGESYPVGPVRLPTILSLTAHDGEFYAATEEGLYRRRDGRWSLQEELGEARVDQVTVVAGRLHARRDGIVYEKNGESFRVSGGEGASPTPLAVNGHSGDPAHDVPSSRALATGDARWPTVCAGDDGLVLHAASGEPLPLDVWLSPDDVSSAAVGRDGRLLLGTTGYGVLVSGRPATSAGSTATSAR